jgi:hypothetical protein
MDLDLEQLAAAVLRLPDAARADLATRLLASLEPDMPADPQVGISAAAVFRVLEADLAAQRAARSETVR